jgi:hypothetical protein
MYFLVVLSVLAPVIWPSSWPEDASKKKINDAA